MGEHAAVYGKPALIAAIDQRLRAFFEPATDLDSSEQGTVHLDLPEVGVSESTSWEDLAHYADARRSAWEHYADAPSAARFDAVRGDDPAHLVKVALGEARSAIGASWRPPGLRLRVESDLPLGGGLGSSAAVAVSLIYGTFALADAPLPADRLAALALDAERRQHGQPSGVDGATVQQGGLIWAARDGAARFTTDVVTPVNDLLAGFEVYDTGTPCESTGEVVSTVRDRVAASPTRLHLALDDIERATRALRVELESNTGSARVVEETVRAAQGGLACLGVVPPAVGESIRALAERGLAAKLSGAGALTGIGAGSLLVYHRADRAPVDASPVVPAYRRLPLTLGARGVCRELS